MTSKKCYWFNQGKCFLYEMEESMIYSILSRVPKARNDLRNCGFDCPEVDHAFLDYAEDPSTLVKEPHEINEDFMQKVNRYRNYQRYAEANATTPKDPDSQ